MSDSDEIQDLDALLNSAPSSPQNRVMEDPVEAVAFVATLLGKGIKSDLSPIAFRFKEEVEQLFQNFQEVSLPNELMLYRRFLTLCERLKVIQKASRLSDKTIVGFGGKFSAGKSSFINSIAGLENMLPEAQDATTSIPTYIIKSKEERLTANTIFGEVWKLSQEELNAMTHEFRRNYEINCAPFVDSIIVETPKYSLDSRIALLDTPGYTKPDNKNDSKMVVSDKIRAYEQLRITDYLIWLVDMDNGTLSPDIQFIDSLGLKTKILIVFNKADLKSHDDMEIILDQAREDVVNMMSTPVFGIAAYSSKNNKEYTGHVIKDYLKEVAKSELRNNDILQQFQSNADEMRQVLETACLQSETVSTELLQFVIDAQNIDTVCSMARLWSEKNMAFQKLSALLGIYDDSIGKLRQMLLESLGEK